MTIMNQSEGGFHSLLAWHCQGIPKQTLFLHSWIQNFNQNFNHNYTSSPGSVVQLLYPIRLVWVMDSIHQDFNAVTVKEGMGLIVKRKVKIFGIVKKLVGFI